MFFLVRFRETERLKERWKTKSKFGSSAAHEVRCLFKLFSDRLLLSFRVNLTWQTLSAGDRRPGNTDVSSRLEGRWQTARPWWAPIGPVVDCGEALTSQSLYFIYLFYFFNARTSLKTQRIHLIISIHSITIWICVWGTQTKLWPPQLIEQLILIYRRLYFVFSLHVISYSFKTSPAERFFCATILWFHAPSDWPTTAAAMTHSVCGVV